MGEWARCSCRVISVCVCVSNPVPKRHAGGQPHEHSWLPNEEGSSRTDMEANHLHVPAAKN